MKLLSILALLAALSACAYVPLAPTEANYTGGQYDENGQSANGFPYNAPYGGGGGGGLD